MLLIYQFFGFFSFYSILPASNSYPGLEVIFYLTGNTVLEVPSVLHPSLFACVCVSICVCAVCIYDFLVLLILHNILQ